MRAKRLGGVWFACPLILMFLVTSGAVCGCNEQDFESLPESLIVQPDQRESRIETPLSHKQVARQSVDYIVSSQAEGVSEAVIEARTAINSVPRADGRAVLRLAPGETQSGRITELELEFGNSLDISLQCCDHSACATSEVQCPVDGEDRDTSLDLQTCAVGCERQVSCRAACKDVACTSACEDEACVDACEVDPACDSACDVEAVRCMATCVTLYARCTSSDITPPPTIACDYFCPGSTETCQVNVDPPCDSGYTDYPAVCLTRCREESAGDVEAQFQCGFACISLYQKERGLSRSGVDPNVAVPCCYENACGAEMSAVVKLAAVECFNDSECGSSRECNRRGLCENVVRDEQTSCSLSRWHRPSNAPTTWIFALLLSLGAWGLRRSISAGDAA